MHIMTKVSWLHVTFGMLIGEGAKITVPIKYGSKIIYSHPEKLVFSAPRQWESGLVTSL